MVSFCTRHESAYDCREDLVVSDHPDNGADERLASLERGLENLKAAVGLLGITPCSWCNIYYRRSDPGALFHYREFVCYDCVPQWWLNRSPELSGDDRQKAERELRRWLVNYHHAEVIGRSRDLPKPERLSLKLVTGCEQCNATGKTYTGGRCPHCDGRGTVWVIVCAPDFAPSSE
jgi:hypothetical protein